MVKNTKTWISWERNIIILRNKKILNLCFRWHTLRSYRFVAEVKRRFKKNDFLNRYPLFMEVKFHIQNLYSVYKLACIMVSLFSPCDWNNKLNMSVPDEILCREANLRGCFEIFNIKVCGVYEYLICFLYWKKLTIKSMN